MYEFVRSEAGRVGFQPELHNQVSPSVSDAKKAGHTPCVRERSNDTDTRIGGDSRCDAEKAGSVHSINSRQSYETEVEKGKFIHESFQLESKAILNEDAELKEDVIKLFLDNFVVLATHPGQYGETDVLEMRINLIPGAVSYRS